MEQILVTGATGFVGHFLTARLLEEGYSVRGTLLESEPPSSLIARVEPAVVDPLGTETSWRDALIGVDTVIHLAARVHIMNDRKADPLSEFRKVNTAGTVHLAREAARAGVKRLVFISTIKVNGEETDLPYTEDSPACPTDPYGISKWEAEQALWKIAYETGLEVVVVRPTLVYGPGVKANFLTMMKVVNRGIPLPFASINNKRSLIYVGNLVDILALCAKHPTAANKTYLVSDGEDVSTPELISATAAALDVPVRLLPFPPALMRIVGNVSGRKAVIDRLIGSLAVDSSRIRRELGWTPQITLKAGLGNTAEWFKRVICP